MSVTHSVVQQGSRPSVPFCSHLSFHNKSLQGPCRKPAQLQRCPLLVHLPGAVIIRADSECSCGPVRDLMWERHQIARNTPELRRSSIICKKRHFTVYQNISAHDPERLVTPKSSGFTASCLLEGAGRNRQQPFVQNCLALYSSLFPHINTFCLECNILQTFPLEISCECHWDTPGPAICPPVLLFD